MGEWVTRGFDAFSRGVFGNAGQNLYVSSAGVLQRIFHFDLNCDGYADLVFCDSQNDWEKPPTSVYEDPLDSRRLVELPAEGGWSGVVIDLTGDGFDDLVVGNHYNGIRRDLSSSVYFGSPDGWCERYTQRLPAPFTTSVAAGDFNGDGRLDLAFLCCPDPRATNDTAVRVFAQTELGFEAKQREDLSLPTSSSSPEQLLSADLDRDGFHDLVVRGADASVRVYWGGENGLSPERFIDVKEASDVPTVRPDFAHAREHGYAEFVADAAPLPATVQDEAGDVCLFLPSRDAAYLVPVQPGRAFGVPQTLPCVNPMAAATGDPDGSGRTSLVVACRDPHRDAERSWVFQPDNEGGWTTDGAVSLPTHGACDVVATDLDGDGRTEIAICQSHTENSYTTDSVVFKEARNPFPFETHDARRVLVGRPRGAEGPPALAFINHFAGPLPGSREVGIYWGGADGFDAERRSSAPSWGAVESLGVDVNDDGWPDLVLANCSENSIWIDPGSYVLHGGLDGLATEPSQILPTTRAHGVACADLDRDGWLDLVFCGFANSELLLLRGGPDGFDIEHPERIQLVFEGDTWSEPRWIYLADLNRDGWLDLVVPNITGERSAILWGSPDGFDIERRQLLSVRHAACARAADLNGNGWLDLIVGGHEPSVLEPHDSFVYIYWNGPDGLSESRRTLLPASAVNAISVADFDNDGQLDVFACSYHAGLERDVDSFLYWNRRGRGFSETDRQRLFTHSASGCVAADFDGDGRVDLAIAYHKVEGSHVGHSAVWWNGEDGFDPHRVTRLPTSGPHGMTAIEPGNQLDRGPEEYYESEPYELPRPARTIEWEAEVPSTCWVRAQVRMAPTRERLGETTWSGPTGDTSWFENKDRLPNRAGRWIQYRLALGARNGCGSPRVTQVRVIYD